MMLALPLVVVFGLPVAAAGIAAGIFVRTAGPVGILRGLLFVIVGAVILALISLIPWVGSPGGRRRALLGVGALVRTAGGRLRTPERVQGSCRRGSAGSAAPPRPATPPPPPPVAPEPPAPPQSRRANGRRRDWRPRRDWVRRRMALHWQPEVLNRAGGPETRELWGWVHERSKRKSILAWIIIGLIAGFVASLIVGGDGGLIGWLIAGLIGSLVGGFLARQLNIKLNFGNPFLEQVVISIVGASSC